MRPTLPDYYPGIVFSAQGEAISRTLWAILPFLEESMEEKPWATSDVTNVPPDIISRGVTGDPLPAVLDPSQRLCYLPVAFPLPSRHGIPVGKVWAPDIGAADFVASIQEMSLGTDEHTRDALE